VFRCLVAAVALGVVALALMGQGPLKGSRVLDTDRLVIRDRIGRIRAILEVDTTDIAQFTLLDGSGKNTARLWVSNEGTTGLTLDERGGSRQGALALGEMTARVLRLGHVGRGFVSVDAGTFDPNVRVVGERSEAVLGRTELTRTHTGGIEIRPAASLILFDKDGKVTWSAP
jgi:hypothetical protein